MKLNKNLTIFNCFFKQNNSILNVLKKDWRIKKNFGRMNSY